MQVLDDQPVGGVSYRPASQERQHQHMFHPPQQQLNMNTFQLAEQQIQDGLAESSNLSLAEALQQAKDTADRLDREL